MEDVVLFMRVRQPKENVRLVLRLDGKEIYSRKLIKALPSQMISIPLKKENLTEGNMLEVFEEEAK